MRSGEIRQKFLYFFEKKGHKIVPSSSLIPTDPSVLFTTAGMQQFKPYFLGEKSPWGPNVVSVQKCLRTSDIDEVGDERHLTFFEMLGNFSFGGYFKEEAIKLAHEFIFQELKLPKENAYATVFAGDERVPEDKESAEIWKKLGMPENKILKRSREDNFWGPTGAEGPCGPTTEIHINGTEIWNIVFNEYYCDKEGQLTPLKQKGVDTGMGLERLAMVVRGKQSVFETDLLGSLLELVHKDLPINVRRIITDHIRAIAFLISDGIRPSNKDTGYVLRRLIRRVIAYAYRKNIGSSPQSMLELVVNQYKEFPDYKNLNSKIVLGVFNQEYEIYKKTVGPEVEHIEKIFLSYKNRGKTLIPPAVIFDLHQSAGVIFDTSSDVANELGLKVDREAFERDLEHHQEISRAGQAKKFGGHGLILDTGEVKAANEEELKKVTRLHTATHLLQAALRRVLGPEVRQRGSDITAERLRFDFTFPRKITSEELNAVERLVQEKIGENLKVEMQEMQLAEAFSDGALTVEGARYPEKVKVYSVNNFSKEVCGGPHVEQTGEIGSFKITKEASVAAGIRRIRATVG